MGTVTAEGPNPAHAGLGKYLAAENIHPCA